MPTKSDVLPLEIFFLFHGKRLELVGIVIMGGSYVVKRSNAEVQDKLESADWKRIMKILVLYCGKELERLHWWNGRVPRGAEAEDLAFEAIADTFDAKRRWDLEQQPDLLKHLKSVVDSKVSHLLELKEYELMQPFPLNEEGEEDETLLKAANQGALHGVEIVRAELPDAERRLIVNELVEQFLHFIKGDEELEDVVLCLLEWVTERKEIAAKLGTDVEEIDRRQKRLRRRYEDFKEQLTKGEVRGYAIQTRRDEEKSRSKPV